MISRVSRGIELAGAVVTDPKLNRVLGCEAGCEVACDVAGRVWDKPQIETRATRHDIQ